MNCLSKIFKDIINDFTKVEYKNQRILSRRFVLDNDIIFIAYYNNVKRTKELAIRINRDFNKELVSKYPDWNGVNVIVSEIESGNDKGLYLSFGQLENSDGNIYDAIVEDIIENIKLVQSNQQIINIVGKVLIKWKQFFYIHDELVMSDIRQQGLYSELMFLEKLISMHGDKALNFWSGCNFETHDFYINGDAIEVKSTSSNNPGSVTISNEYQLDANDVNGNLYLVFISLRKSLSDGQTIPLIVQRILNKLDSSMYLEIFEEKLFKYGYLLRNPELYKIGFVVREIKYFSISDEFPSITKGKLPNSIFNVSYKLNINSCDRFSVLEETLIRKLKEV
ncbi:PD-(D/E)XK motif protein [Clostridium sp.]|uniref:PD-(D/E)XK motif protein n=1 Tax=Clostridium sp. TaxID=1506 RepID=UPI0032165CE9